MEAMPFHLDMKRIRSVLFALLLLAAPAAVQAQFAYVTNNGAVILTGYSGTAGTVVISNFVNVITNYVFYNRSSLTNLTMGSGLLVIGVDAFISCPLVSVTIPNSVTSIGAFAFYSCTALTNVILGNNVATIGDYAFNSCSMTSVTIPNSVTNLGGSVFDACSALAQIKVDSGNLFYASQDGVLFNQSLTTLIQYPGGLSGGYSIPSSVTAIGDVAFGNCPLTSVTIPAGVISIGGGFPYTYQPGAGGQRFLMALPPGGQKPPPITMVLNWQAGLKK